MNVCETFANPLVCAASLTMRVLQLTTSTMSSKPAPDRTSIESRIAARQSDLASAQTAHREACARLVENDNPDVRHEVAELEVEIAEHRAHIARLEQAIEHRAHQTSAAAIQERKARLAELMAQRRKTAAESQRLAVKVVEHIAALGPLWQAAVAAFDAHGQVTQAAARLVPAPNGRRLFDGLDTAGRSYLGEAVRSALASTGLGSTGPSLAPTVIDAPLQPFSVDDLQRYLNRMHSQQDGDLQRAAAAQVGDEA